MPDKTKSERINPRVREIDIGIRNLRKIKIYPLSMADQMKLTKIINESLQTFFNLDEKEGKEGQLQFAAYMVSIIESNINKLLKLVCPDETPSNILKEIDNAQLSEIVKCVYQDNYEQPVKNVTSLFPKEQLQSVLKRQSQPSVSDTDIDSIISTEPASEMEA